MRELSEWLWCWDDRKWLMDLRARRRLIGISMSESEEL